MLTLIVSMPTSLFNCDCLSVRQGPKLTGTFLQVPLPPTPLSISGSFLFIAIRSNDDTSFVSSPPPPSQLPQGQTPGTTSNLASQTPGATSNLASQTPVALSSTTHPKQPTHAATPGLPSRASRRASLLAQMRSDMAKMAKIEPADDIQSVSSRGLHSAPRSPISERVPPQSIQSHRVHSVKMSPRASHSSHVTTQTPEHVAVQTSFQGSEERNSIDDVPKEPIESKNHGASLVGVGGGVIEDIGYRFWFQCRLVVFIQNQILGLLLIVFAFKWVPRPNLALLFNLW